VIRVSVMAFSIAMTLRGPVGETSFPDFQYFFQTGVNGPRSQISEVGPRLKGTVLASKDGTPRTSMVEVAGHLSPSSAVAPASARSYRLIILLIL
jgi:hypothetical protein